MTIRERVEQAIKDNPKLALRLFRETMGLNQYELAEQLGTIQSSISKVESRARSISPRMLKALVYKILLDIEIPQIEGVLSIINNEHNANTESNEEATQG